ncbi:MAG: hypothetical protein AB1427_01725 [Thermodesulfobacteriota bacterium]
MLTPIKPKTTPAWIAAIVFAATLSFCLVRAQTPTPLNYSRLIEFIQLQDREDPLYVFEDYQEGFDTASQQANFEYLNSNPGLIKKIRTGLAGAPLRWSLQRLRHRLLFVPEKRQVFAALYENYCKDVIRFVLDRTKFANPFHDILTLDLERPRRTSPVEGVMAFLVHNLAKEFQATNIFSGREENKVELKLRGKIFIGDIGSYTSHVELLDSGKIKFSRNTYTIWQNSADNPYTALMTPAEETLHILLRPYTERAIEKQLMRLQQKTVADVKNAADEWIAMEEAVAGGLTYKLMLLFFEKFIPDFPASLIGADLDTKMKRKKYRYLRCGIDLVSHIGYNGFLYQYQSDPVAFRKSLLAFRSLPGHLY